MMEPHVLMVTKGLDLGGLERVVVDLAFALQRRGLSVEVAVVNGSRDALIAPLEQRGVVVHRLGGTDRIGVSAGRRYASLLDTGSYDVVHAHGPLTAVMARLLSRGTPVVSTVHTVWKALHPLTRLAWLATWPKEAATVAVSDAVRLSLPERVAQEVVVIPHGVDPSAIQQALAVAQHTREGVAPTAVVVASHRPAKGYPILLHALRATRERGVDVRLIAVGEGPDLKRHRALAAELGLAAAVDFLPPTADVLTVIAEADLLVVASSHEGQPLVVVEALALGRPVVATSVGRVPALVSPHVGRVVPPADVGRLSDALVEVAGQRGLRDAMHQAALRLPRWTVDDVVSDYLPLYIAFSRESPQ